MILVASGISMLPNVREGDWLEVEIGDLTPGVIVVTTNGHLSVAHRLMRVRRHAGKTDIITRGDNMPYCDTPWTSEQVIGVVTRIIRPAGDFVPGNRITLILRLRWAYLALRWRASQVKRRLEHLLGRS